MAPARVGSDRAWFCVLAAPLECKKYEVDTFRGCDDQTALNYCEKVTEPDNTLCRSECSAA